MRDLGEPSFGADVSSALGAWRRFPWLPIVSVLIGVAAQLPGPLAVLGAVVVIAGIGWVGTERIAYLRAFRGKSMTVSDLSRFTREYIGRYALLGITFLLVTVPAFFAFRRGSHLGFLVVFYAMIAIIDVALTFVTPALAFTTRRVRSALRIGLGMIRSEWPSSALYVLAPPLAAVFLAQSLSRWAHVGIAGAMIASAIATLANLCFKGATAAFYLRRHDVGDDGSAFAPSKPVLVSDPL
jgi:hypothetical protein